MEYITLTFKEKSTSFYSNSSSVFSLGFFSTIKNTLIKTQKSNLYKIRPFLIGLFWILMWFFLSKIIYSVIDNEKFKDIIPFVNFVIILFVSRDIKLFQYKNDFILTKNRKDYNFYREHKDWIIGITTTIIGYLVGKFL